MGKSMKEVSEELELIDRQDEINNITSIANEILVKDTIKARMPEDVFKNMFMVAIAVDDRKYDLLKMKWVEFAGGPYNEVELIDKNGVVVVTAPGLYKQPVVDDSNKLPFSEIGGEYLLRKDNLAGDVNGYMNKVVNELARRTSIDSTTETTRWNNIFKHYSKPACTAKAAITDKEVIKNIPNKDLEDMIDYD